MKKMFRVVATCCCLLAGSIGQAGAADAVDVITGQGLADILREEGFAPTLTKPRVISMKMEGRSVGFFVSETGGSIQAYAGFKAPKASLGAVNTWNKTKRFSRAYLDDDGDPVIELDLDLAGGVTKERIIDFVRTVRLSLSEFAGSMYGRD